MKYTTRNAWKAIGERKTFRTSGALSGTYSPSGSGRLEGEALWIFRNMQAQALHVYYVMSYGTPIAWQVPGKEPYLVDQKFSPTTSKHQGQARLGMSTPTAAAPCNQCQAPAIAGCPNYVAA